MKQYIIINKKNGAPLSRITKSGRKVAAVMEHEVQHDEFGLVRMLDVLTVMGYQIERYEIAILPQNGPMSRESRYNLDDLRVICLDTETGIIA